MIFVFICDLQFMQWQVVDCFVNYVEVNWFDYVGLDVFIVYLCVYLDVGEVMVLLSWDQVGLEFQIVG